jgi:hypothetical protein
LRANPRRFISSIMRWIALIKHLGTWTHASSRIEDATYPNVLHKRLKANRYHQAANDPTTQASRIARLSSTDSGE